MSAQSRPDHDLIKEYGAEIVIIKDDSPEVTKAWARAFGLDAEATANWLRDLDLQRAREAAGLSKRT